MSRHGLTQEECAKELGFKDRRQIVNYEKGDSEIPRYVWLATEAPERIQGDSIYGGAITRPQYIRALSKMFCISPRRPCR